METSDSNGGDPETWGSIPFASGYLASDLGRVASTLKRSLASKGLGPNGMMIMKTPTNRNGYRCVSLQIGGRSRVFLVHRLVLETFVGPRPEGMECRHLDSNPLNNRLDNLAWDTHSANMLDQHFLAKIHARPTSSGKRTQVLGLRNQGLSYYKIASMLDMNATTVRRICVLELRKNPSKSETA